MRYEAVLNHGSTYILGGIAFANGQPQTIDRDTKEWLESRALCASGCRFAFTEITEEQPTAEPEVVADETVTETVTKPARRRR